MKVSHEGIKVPNTCPPKCGLKNESFGQGGYCHRCPVFNCAGDEKLLEPAHYRADWAREWAKFFATGELPILNLEQPKNGAQI